MKEEAISTAEPLLADLAARLRAGDATAEPSFIAALDQLANRLVLGEPAALYPLMQSLQDVPLAVAANRQLYQYFSGLALGLAEYYPDAIAALDALLDESPLADEVRGRALNARAVFCRYTGRLADALAGYEASLELWQRLGNRLRQGIALLNQGIVTYQLQEYAEAEARLVEARRCFEATGSGQWQTAAQSELGLVYRDLGRLDEALAAFHLVAERHRAAGLPEAEGRALVNISETLLWRQEFAAAAEKAEEALALLSNRLYAVDAYLALGLASQLGGQLPAAQAAFEEALSLALAIGRRDILAEVHYRLGELLRRQGQAAAALTHLEAAAAVVEESRRPLRQEAVKISLLGRWQQIYETLVLYCLDLGQTQAALAWTERARARAFLEAVGGESAIDGSIALSPLPAAVTALSYFTTGVVERSLPLLRSLPAASPLCQQLLPPPRTLLFVQRQQTLDVFDCPLNPNLLASVSPRRADRSRLFASPVLRRLYGDLINRALPTLAGQNPAGLVRSDSIGPDRPAGFPVRSGRAINRRGHEGHREEADERTLLIVPHGPLHELPFAALEDETGRPLLHAAGPALLYAPSLTMAVGRPDTTIAGRSCLAIGYDGPARQGLRHPEAEARWIAGLTGGEAWCGPQAKARDLQQTVGQYRWLHIACHGLFDEESPLDSYLETGAGERLTAREVLETWRLPAGLVTLSACQTGVSRLLPGDEPMGLVRAFLVAGATHVLVSQWPVADLPAFLLMRAFYRHMAAGRPPAAALQAAQIWLRQLQVEDVRAMAAELPAADLENLPALPFAHPVHWAAFILVGRV